MSINMELMRKKLAQLRGEDKGDGNSPAFRAPNATMVSAVQFVTLLLSFGEKEAIKMTKNPKSLLSLSLCEHVTFHQWSSAAEKMKV